MQPPTSLVLLVLLASGAAALGAYAAPMAACALLRKREAGKAPGVAHRPQSPDPTRAERVLCALALGTVAVLAGLLLCPPTCLLVTAGALLMAVMCLCDLRARIIPWEPCAALLALGLVYALVAGSPGALLASLLLAGVVLGTLEASNLLSGRLHGTPAIGAGDLRALPALCLFGGVSGSLLGMFACALIMSCAATCALVSRNATRSSHLPLAPGLAIWFLTGSFFRDPSVVLLSPISLM